MHNPNVMTFREFLTEHDWLQYEMEMTRLIGSVNESTSELSQEETQLLFENMLKTLSNKMKTGVGFIKEFSTLVKVNFLDMLKMFKNKVLFSFFSKIKWSVKELVKLVKSGYNLQGKLKTVIDGFIEEHGVVKWTKDKLDHLDEFLSKHPMIKKTTGLVVVGFLIYQWTQLISFTGDVDFDFDQSLLFEAIKGNFSLSDLFASPDGITMLSFIALNTLTGISFPWKGATWVLFTFSLVYTTVKQKYPNLAQDMIKNLNRFKTVK